MPLADRKMPRIYLAGPMVFYPDPAAVFGAMKEICARHGLEGVAPVDNQAGLGEIPPGKTLTLKIVQADFELMDHLDGGIFCLDPFRRGPEMDPGTTVEIGYMKAQGKPLAGWTTDGRAYPEKVRDYFSNVFDAELTATKANDAGGTSGMSRDPDGMLVHSDGMVQNGMTEGGIELSGGVVCCGPDWQIAFENAVRILAERFRRA